MLFSYNQCGSNFLIANRESLNSISLTSAGSIEPLAADQGVKGWAVVAATGVILAALYLLWAYQRVFHGPQNPEDEPTKDLTNWERLTLLPLIVGIVFLGIYPKPMLDRIEPAVDKLVSHIEDTIEDGVFTEPVPITQNRTSFSDLLMQTHESHGHNKHGDTHHGDHDEGHDSDHHGNENHSGGHE